MLRVQIADVVPRNAMPGTFQESGSRDLGLKYSTTPNPGSVSGSKSMTYMQLERFC
jgi:hypothetical protein